MSNGLHGKVVLVLGGSVMQLPLILQARLQGMQVVVMDQNPHALGFRAASEGLLVDISNAEVAAEEALGCHRQKPLDAVLTVGTDFVQTVSLIASRLNILGGLEEGVARAVTDKIEMRRCLSRNGFSKPEFYGFDTHSIGIKKACSTLLERGLSLPWVVKPADSMGARGVRKVEEVESFERAWNEANAHSRRGRIIVEEYLPGRELSVDALVFEGEVVVCGVADRVIEHEPYFVETGHVIPSREPEEILSEACSVFKRAVRALGIVHGAAKGDLRLTDEGVVVGEVAGRLSGGYMSGYTVPYSSGVNLMRLLLGLTFGERPSIVQLGPGRVAMDVGLVGPVGRVRSIEGVGVVRRLVGVRRVDLHVKVGEVLGAPKNNLMKAGNVLVVGDSYEAVFRLAKQVRSTIVIR